MMTIHQIQNRRRTSRPGIRRGFTLVEMMIVIMAMVIMAGMVIPQYLEAVADAKKSTTLHNVVMLTVAIERYKLHHYGDPPDILTGNTLPQLTAKTDEYGNMGSGPLYIYGPYVPSGFPENSINHTADVSVTTTVPPKNLGTRVGWIYDRISGQIWAGEGK